MEVLVWLLPGALIGWTASMLMRREAIGDLFYNVIVGVAGAAAGAWLLGPALGMPNAAAPALQLAILGAILTLAAFNLVLPKSLRQLGRTSNAVDARAVDDRGHVARG